jgi:hypothetical protein
VHDLEERSEFFELEREWIGHDGFLSFVAGIKFLPTVQVSNNMYSHVIRGEIER